ncbi:MAG TPA: EamA family transporter [Actinomycetota bacterium]|nr:EamA family transporter [Actinomycetota bacterium]
MRAETPQQDAPAWMVWAALWTVYIVWGSTYLAIRISVETLPPLLTAGVRFLIAGLLMYVFLLVRKGSSGVKITRPQLLGATFVGTALLLGGNGIVMIAEQYVASGVASLLIATVPLWVILLRAVAKERVPSGTLWGVLVGFVGVALLVLPGDKPDDAPVTGMLLLVLAAAFWAAGSFSSRRLPLPPDPLLSTAAQMLTGGAVMLVVGLGRGELGSVVVEEFSTRSLLALAYLIFIGSLVAFTAYVWVLQHAPVSKVATYAYVNPVIAVFLGWIVLSEEITPFVLAGAAVIVSSVAFIVRKESQHEKTEVSPDLGPASVATADA